MVRFSTHPRFSIFLIKNLKIFLGPPENPNHKKILKIFRWARGNPKYKKIEKKKFFERRRNPKHNKF